MGDPTYLIPTRLLCPGECADTSTDARLKENGVSDLMGAKHSRVPQTDDIGAKSFCSSSKPIDDRRLSRVMGFIDAHIDRRVGVADLAAVACMSTAHFARSFKTTTGRSPHEFVNRKRVELACRMLAERHRPIADIALSTGFSSQSNFSRAFRHAMGMTPGAYRAARLAED